MEKRMGDERRKMTRREDDPLSVQEATWQEACGALAKTIQQLQEGYLNFSRRVILVLCLIGFLLVGILAVEGVLIIDNNNRVSDIQNSRVAQCIDSNHRHDNTLAAIDSEIKQIGLKFGFQSKIYRQAKANETPTATIISVLVPKHKDCDTFVRSG